MKLRYLLPALLLVVSAGLARAAEPEPPSMALFAGRLVTIDQDGTGALTKGDDLYALRLVVAVPGPLGLRVGFRGDLTALSYIDPATLDPTALRTAEGYGAVSWSTKALGVTLGPAVFAGALIPVQDAVEWRMKGAYGGGLRVGLGSSYVYAMVGKDKASDDRAGGVSPTRLIVPFAVEVPIWKTGIGLQGEIVTGVGGRWRAAVMARIPNPWSGQ